MSVDLAGSTSGKESVSTQPSMTPSAFVEKWRGVTTSEKASSQSHFIDLCRMLGEPIASRTERRIAVAKAAEAPAAYGGES